MRTRAEQELATQAGTALAENVQQTQRSAEDLGIKGEKYLGTSNLPTGRQIQTGATPITGQAGTYGIQTGTQARSLFAPTGGTTGTLEQDRLEAEEKRKRGLVSAERELRGYYTA